MLDSAVTKIHIWGMYSYIHAFTRISGESVSRILDSFIGPDKDRMSTLKCVHFPTLQFKMCFGCSKESSHWDRSFEYPQHMFWLRNKKNNFQIRTLIWRHELFYLIFQLRSFNKRIWLKCRQLQLNYYMRRLSTRTIVAIKSCLFACAYQCIKHVIV